MNHHQNQPIKNLPKRVSEWYEQEGLTYLGLKYFEYSGIFFYNGIELIGQAAIL